MYVQFFDSPCYYHVQYLNIYIVVKYLKIHKKKLMMKKNGDI